MDSGYWMLDTGIWILDTGCPIQDLVSSIRYLVSFQKKVPVKLPGLKRINGTEFIILLFWFLQMQLSQPELQLFQQLLLLQVVQLQF